MLLLWAANVFAGPSAQLMVTARVLPRADLQLQNAPAQVSISPEDVRRGFVQLQAPLEVAVATNIPAGVFVEFSSPLDFVVRTEAEILDGSVRGSARVLLQQNAAPVRVNLRLFLSPATVPGTYPRPVRVSTGA